MRLLTSIFAASLIVFAAAAASAQTPVSCSDNAQGISGDPGTSVTVMCPSGCGSSTAWGTGVYSDDSSICTSAIHAGVITNAGGAVQVTIAPGQSAYPSSAQNGITTSQWGSWGRSFTVTAPAMAPVTLACNQNAQTLEGGPGTTFAVTCPAGCGFATAWGTGMYSDDSAICTAGIHAGVVSNAGGSFTVTIAPGQQSYTASTQNGITTSQWGSWSRSFTVAP